MIGIAGPDEADLEALHFAEPAAPALDRLGRRPQIRKLGRNSFEPGTEQARQAQQHRVALVGRRIAAVAEHVDAGQAFAQQPHQLLVHAQRDLAGARGEKGSVACELQSVAEPLFGLHINVLAGETFALPWFFRKSRPLAFSRAQPPLVFVPAFGEVAAHQQQNAQAGMGIGVVRRQRDSAAQHRDAFLEIAVVVQSGSEIGPAVGEIGVDRNGAAIGDDGFVEPPQRMQCIAEIAMRLGKIGIGGDRLALRRGGFLVFFELVERDAEIAQRRRHGRLDIERRAGGRGRELRPAGEPEHFAEIGMKQRDMRRELGRAFDVLDRVAELAVLVRDDAQEMLRLRDIRLRLEDLPADRFGLHQQTLRAAALGVHERLAERHESLVGLGLNLRHRIPVTCRSRLPCGRGNGQGAPNGVRSGEAGRRRSLRGRIIW